MLRPYIMALCHKLQIAHAFAFPGWVSYHLLPAALLGVDVMVNPSVRDWSETFCIANIEAMAMLIPLVTFAVGGVGQYVEAPLGSEEEGRDFALGGNAVVVSRPHPTALRDAMEFRVMHAAEREAMAQRALERVQRHFSLEIQMRKYREFYLTCYRA